MDKKILIVEDEKALRDALSDKLKNEKFVVIEATNGEEGLKMAVEEQPDLILLDIIMPVMDGFTMIGKLREAEKTKGLTEDRIPIILLTNVDQEKGMGPGQKLGIYDYLVKSDWGLQNIVKKIKDKLDMRN